MKVVRTGLAIILIASAVLLIVINYRVYNVPEILVTNSDTLSISQLKHLRNLGKQTERNAGEQMQQLYPEGYVFFHALSGLAWVDFASSLSKTSPYYREALSEIQRCYDRIQSPQARNTFDDSLPLPYGAFYNGWMAMLLGGKLRIESLHERDPGEILIYKTLCDSIGNILSSCTYPESYWQAAWPADAITCIAALAEHDKLFAPKYDRHIRQWIANVRANLDENGLIPHKVIACTGKITQSSRGSSQSLMLSLLPGIDEQFAREQFSIFKEKFVDTRCGLTGIREYPKGKNGNGDIDSGPVILDMGGAATIVTIKAAYINGDFLLGRKLSGTVEALGFAATRNGEKAYLFGTLPIADAFIAWARSKDSGHAHPKTYWGTFHLYSLLLLLVLTITSLYILKAPIPFKKQLAFKKIPGRKSS